MPCTRSPRYPEADLKVIRSQIDEAWSECRLLWLINMALQNSYLYSSDAGTHTIRSAGAARRASFSPKNRFAPQEEHTPCHEL
jgi:hypothetical protein